MAEVRGHVCCLGSAFKEFKIQVVYQTYSAQGEVSRTEAPAVAALRASVAPELRVQLVNLRLQPI